MDSRGEQGARPLSGGGSRAQEWTVLVSAADAGLIAAVLVAVQRCSMGAWAGMLLSRIMAAVSSMNVMSALCAGGRGRAAESWHCWEDTLLKQKKPVSAPRRWR